MKRFEMFPDEPGKKPISNPHPVIKGSFDMGISDVGVEVKNPALEEALGRKQSKKNHEPFAMNPTSVSVGPEFIEMTNIKKAQEKALEKKKLEEIDRLFEDNVKNFGKNKN